MEAPSNTSVPENSQVAVPKEDAPQTSANSPPPAYTPRTQPDLTTLAARVIQARQSTMPQVFQQRPLYTTLLPSTPDEEDAPESSPISLRITTSINITKNNNLVCLGASPADHANAIAQAVVRAIQENSSGQCGIPMIDEQGCPRPLKIEVDAGILVEGSGNVVGSQEIISEVLRQRGQLRRQREETEEDIYDAPAKRRRSQ
ncbi:Fc.00g066660.m01.CDS01 [Cosmosporella sp. VM-42]